MLIGLLTVYYIYHEKELLRAALFLLGTNTNKISGI